MGKIQLKSALGLSLLAEIVSKLVPLFLLGMASRRLGLNAFGESQWLIVTMEFMIPFVAYGYVFSAAAELKHDSSRIAKVASRLLSLKLMHAVVASVAVLVYARMFEPDRWWSVLVLCPLLFFSALDLMPVLMAQQKTHLFNLSVAFSKLISLLLVGLFVSGPNDLVIYVWCYMGANAIVALMTLGMVWKQAPLEWPSGLLNMFWRSSPFALVVLAGNFLERYDVFLMEYGRGIEELGRYMAPYKLSQSLYALLYTLSIVLLADAMNRDRQTSLTSLKRNIVAVILILLPAAAGLIFVESDIISWIFGSGVPSIPWSLPILALAAGFHGISGLVGTQTLSLEKRALTHAMILGIGFAASLVLSGVGLYWAGPLGVALGVLLGRILIFAVLIRTAQLRFTSSQKRWMMRGMVATGAMGAVLSVISWPTPVMVAIGAAIYSSVLLGLGRGEPLLD